MQLRFFDYLVLIVAYMLVSLRGGKVMSILKINKFSGTSNAFFWFLFL